MTDVPRPPQDTQGLRDRVVAALRDVSAGDGMEDIVAAGAVRDLEVTGEGDVEFGLLMRPEQPAELAGRARDAAAAVAGVRSVRVNVQPEPEPQGGGSRQGPPSEAEGEAAASASGPRRGSGRALPVMDPSGPSPEARRPGRGGSGAPPGARPTGVDREASSRHPSEAPPLEGVRRVVAVSSGKGGVGKSTVSTNLAAAWALAGHRVGLVDADIYGPDIPTMFGVRGKPRMTEGRVVPLEAHGVRLMSLGFLVDEDTPAIWRGPIVMGIVRQFLQQVEWGELDYLVVDLPPGTGDAQLSLCQLVRVDGAVMVTTPQDVAVGGVLKGIRMFQKLDVPVLGIVENMRGFVCPECGSRHDIFGSGGGETLAAALDVPFLGAVPLGVAVRQEGDRGVPTVVGRPEAPEARALAAVAEATGARLEGAGAAAGT